MRRLTIIACVALAGAVCAPPRLVWAQTNASSSSSTSSKPTANKKKKRHSRRQPKQMAPTPDRIEEIQSVLARDGYYQGTPNGKWDSTTTAAMQKFQGEHGLEATGKIDALSLQKLGLGSEIAGVSAPRPVTPGAPKPTSGAAPQAPKLPSSQAPSGTPQSQSSTSPSVSAASTAKPSIPQPQQP